MKNILFFLFFSCISYSAFCQQQPKRMAFIITIDDDFPDISDFSDSKLIIKNIEGKLKFELPFRYQVGQLIMAEKDYNKLFKLSKPDTLYVQLQTRNYRLDTSYVYEEKIPLSMINDMYMIIKIYNKKKAENRTEYIFPENKDYVFQVISPGFNTLLKRK